MNEILTPQENAEIEWAQKHRIPTFRYLPLLWVVSTNSIKLANYVGKLFEARQLPEHYQREMETRKRFSPRVVYCTPIQAYLLEKNCGVKRL